MVQLKKDELLDLFEAAALLLLPSGLLVKFTEYCPKYKEDRKLKPVSSSSNLPRFHRSELKDYDKYLRAPWPTQSGHKRAPIPEYIILKSNEKVSFTVHCVHGLTVWK